MASLTLRLTKGSPLTNAEVDNNFTALNTELTGKLDSTTYTASDILTKIKTVDGSGSGLDADTLDGANAASTNTASTVVLRDASGNFSAGTITAALNGNATTATSASSASTATTSTTSTNLAGGAAGAVPYQSAANTTAMLSAGTSGQLLKSNGSSAPSWVNQSSIDAGSVNGKTLGSFTAAGGILYATSTTAAASIGAGTAGQALVSNGSSAPSWATVGAAITDNTTTNASYYLGMSASTSGVWTSAVVSSTKLYFNPSTGQLNATNFNSLSDASLKTNVVKISNATEIVKKIDGVEYDWVDSGMKSAGVIADKLMEILPHLVSVNEQGIKSVNYAGLSAYLIETVKELSDRLDKLENR